MQDRLREAAPILQRLHDAGFEGYYVGGCVRDSVLGRPVNDVDIATSATPEEMMALFPRHVPTGLQHGTVTVLQGGCAYEVTTFREESVYEAHRRPAEVAFIRELEGDLLRRDFTVNAMAMRMDGTVIDPFGGMADIGKGVIRCVGDADARFQEDALRMLRGIRFAAAFGYRFAHRTWSALLRHRGLLRHIAMERVGAELDKIVAGSDPARGIMLTHRARLWELTKTPLSLSGEQLDASQPCADLRELPRLTDPDQRWAAVWLASGTDGHAALAWMGGFALGHRRLAAIEAVMKLHRTLAAAPEPTRSSWTALALANGREVARDAVALGTNVPAMTPAGSVDWNRLEAWLTAMPIFKVRDLAIGGNELAKLGGRKPGAWIRLLLEELLRGVAAGEIPNDRDLLRAEAKRRLEGQEEQR